MRNDGHNGFELPGKLRQSLNSPLFRIVGIVLWVKALGDIEREEEISRHWAEFLKDDLPCIEVALKKEKWIWEPVEESAAD